MYYVEDHHHLFLENVDNQVQPRLMLQLNKL
jgi:hypothetical protein